MNRDDDGFTLIELMVVVLIIAILLAIAIPTYLGARDRANNRAVQSNLRNAHTNELAFYTDRQGFTDDTIEMTKMEPSLTWTNLATDMALSPKTIFVTLPTPDEVVLGAKSKSGTCYWLRAVGDQDVPRFASNDCAATPAAADFSDSW